MLWTIHARSRDFCHTSIEFDKRVSFWPGGRDILYMAEKYSIVCHSVCSWFNFYVDFSTSFLFKIFDLVCDTLSYSMDVSGFFVRHSSYFKSSSQVERGCIWEVLQCLDIDKRDIFSNVWICTTPNMRMNSHDSQIIFFTNSMHLIYMFMPNTKCRWRSSHIDSVAFSWPKSWIESDANFGVGVWLSILL